MGDIVFFETVNYKKKKKNTDWTAEGEIQFLIKAAAKFYFIKQMLLKKDNYNLI